MPNKKVEKKQQDVKPSKKFLAFLKALPPLNVTEAKLQYYKPREELEQRRNKDVDPKPPKKAASKYTPLKLAPVPEDSPPVNVKAAVKRSLDEVSMPARDKAQVKVHKVEAQVFALDQKDVILCSPLQALEPIDCLGAHEALPASPEL